MFLHRSLWNLDFVVSFVLAFFPDTTNRWVIKLKCSVSTDIVGLRIKPPFIISPVPSSPISSFCGFLSLHQTKRNVLLHPLLCLTPNIEQGQVAWGEQTRSRFVINATGGSSQQQTAHFLDSLFVVLVVVSCFQWCKPARESSLFCLWHLIHSADMTWRHNDDACFCPQPSILPSIHWQYANEPSVTQLTSGKHRTRGPCWNPPWQAATR